MSRGYAGNGALELVGSAPRAGVGRIGGAVGPEATVAGVPVLARSGGKATREPGAVSPNEQMKSWKVADLPWGQG